MLAHARSSEVWAAGAAYEPYVGRWSRRVAADFIGWLSLPANRRWLDVGCGTGALTQAIAVRATPAAVVGLDPSDGFLAYARAHTQDERVKFQHGDAQSLPYGDGDFDAAVSGLVLNFLPRPEQALAEMKRVLRPGGTAAVYVWDYAGEMQLMRHFWTAAAALDPTATALDEGRRFPICQPEPLIALFETCGFAHAECHVLDVPTVFENFDDYWSPFLGGQGPAPTYTCNLSQTQREALCERLRATLPSDRDGSIHLTARAFAVRGRKDA
jgi:SAM-dependent methyltransferase